MLAVKTSYSCVTWQKSQPGTGGDGRYSDWKATNRHRAERYRLSVLKESHHLIRLGWLRSDHWKRRISSFRSSWGMRLDRSLVWASQPWLPPLQPSKESTSCSWNRWFSTSSRPTSLKRRGEWYLVKYSWTAWAKSRYSLTSLKILSYLNLLIVGLRGFWYPALW